MQIDGEVLKIRSVTFISKYGEDYSLFDITGVEIAQDGWIRKFDLGSKAEIIPSSIAGTDSTYKCDYHWCNVNFVKNRTLLVGGSADNVGNAGLGCFTSNNVISFADANVSYLYFQIHFLGIVTLPLGKR